jgi:hypothetical protein
MRSIFPSATNPILIRDIETNYFLNFSVEISNERNWFLEWEFGYQTEFWLWIQQLKRQSEWECNKSLRPIGIEPTVSPSGHAPFHWAMNVLRLLQNKPLVHTISGFTAIYFEQCPLCSSNRELLLFHNQSKLLLHSQKLTSSEKCNSESWQWMPDRKLEVWTQNRETCNKRRASSARNQIRGGGIRNVHWPGVMIDRAAAAPFHRFCPKIWMPTKGLIRVEYLNGSQIPTGGSLWGTDSWKYEHHWPNFEPIFVGTFSIRFPRNLHIQIEDFLESVWHQGFGFRVDLDWFG